MAVCIRFFSAQKRDIVTEFLGIITLTEASANVLYEALTLYLESIDLPIKNLVGIDTDGASVMVGVNHSLFTLLRDKVPLPNLILVKCICHSLALCASKASLVLPSSLEFLLREARNWFAMSPKRRDAYATLFNLINDNNIVMLNLVQLCVTRWLAWGGAVKRILNQWLELKTHFKMIASSGRDKCYTAVQLSLMFDDPANHLYLLFLNSILHDVNETNVLFQRTHQDLNKLYEALWSLILSVASRLIKPTFLEKAKRENPAE